MAKWNNKYGLYNPAYGARDFVFFTEDESLVREIVKKTIGNASIKVEEDLWSVHKPYCLDVTVTATGDEAIKLIDAFKKAKLKGKYYDGLIQWTDL